MPNLKCKIGGILAEAVVIAVIGFAAALTANEVSPRGLALNRNYFPAGTNAAPAVPKPAPVFQNVAGTNSSTTNVPSDADDLSERLRDKGLQEIKRPQLEKLFHDPRTQEGRVIFVDARDEEHYADGHIPGAYELDPYHPENQIGTVLPVCQAAEEVIVYCTGGECEDADTAAIILRDAGLSNKKIFVYGGGFTEWHDNHLPLEAGERNSGQKPK